jgi:hypothetical protein
MCKQHAEADARTSGNDRSNRKEIARAECSGPAVSVGAGAHFDRFVSPSGFFDLRKEWMRER